MESWVGGTGRRGLQGGGKVIVTLGSILLVVVVEDLMNDTDTVPDNVVCTGVDPSNTDLCHMRMKS